MNNHIGQVTKAPSIPPHILGHSASHLSTVRLLDCFRRPRAWLGHVRGGVECIAVCSDPVEKPARGPSIKEPVYWPVLLRFFYAWTPLGPRFLYRIRAYCNRVRFAWWMTLTTGSKVFGRVCTSTSAKPKANWRAKVEGKGVHMNQMRIVGSLRPLPATTTTSSTPLRLTVTHPYCHPHLCACRPCHPTPPIVIHPPLCHPFARRRGGFLYSLPALTDSQHLGNETQS
eukprot:659375-Pyramimonas_sp.AAC.2